MNLTMKYLTVPLLTLLVAIGATALADRIRSVVPWITEGLLLGRPIGRVEGRARGLFG